MDLKLHAIGNIKASQRTCEHAVVSVKILNRDMGKESAAVMGSYPTRFKWFVWWDVFINWDNKEKASVVLQQKAASYVK